MARVKRTDEERAAIAETLKAAAAGEGWQRVEAGKSLREQKSGAEASEASRLFGPMVDQIVKFGAWVQYVVKSEPAAKALVSAIGRAAREAGHGMRSEFAKLPDGTYAVQFKAGKLRERKSAEKPAEGQEEAPTATSEVPAESVS